MCVGVAISLLPLLPFIFTRQQRKQESGNRLVSRARIMDPELGTCPRCSSTLARRRRRRDGKPFVGCSSYPRCKYTRDLAPHSGLS
ncbi:MAG: topoisomerase DNA-binding C4 zinc finger domain-containing protein [Gemmataceae bacterium]